MSSSTSGWETCKHGNNAPKYILRDIPESQGGVARHGCVVCAFNAGVEEGKRQERNRLERESKGGSDN